MKVSYERDPELSGAYKTVKNPDVAYKIIGWETKSDEDTEWSGFEHRTGKVVAHMIGDDHLYTFDIDDLIKIHDDEYCGSCGQIGCSHD